MNKENLRLKLEAFGVSNKLEELEELQKDTLATNVKFNLTAIKDEEKFRELMILDSLYPLSLVDFSNKKIIDVGSSGCVKDNSTYYTVISIEKDVDSCMLGGISNRGRLIIYFFFVSLQRQM